MGVSQEGGGQERGVKRGGVKRGGSREGGVTHCDLHKVRGVEREGARHSSFQHWWQHCHRNHT